MTFTPEFREDTPDVTAWKALAMQRLETLSADQLSLLGHGWVGIMVRSKMDGDQSQYSVAALKLNEVFREFCRRSKDLDNHLVPRTEM